MPGQLQRPKELLPGNVYFEEGAAELTACDQVPTIGGQIDMVPPLQGTLSAVSFIVAASRKFRRLWASATTIAYLPLDV